MTRDHSQSVALNKSANNSSPKKYDCVLILIGWLGLFVFAVMVAFHGGIEPKVRLFQCAYAIGFAGYLLLVWVVLGKLPNSPISSWPWWLIGSLTLRVLLITTTPSDDVYRYIWEGRIQLAGFNPYAHSPDDPALTQLRGDDWEKINHPDYPAIYPPLAQVSCLLAAAIYPSPISIKCLVLLCDAIIILLLASILRSMGRRPHEAILYALCPLVITSFAIEGHIDSLMLLFTLLSIRAAQVNRMNFAGIALGLAISSKLIVIILLPWLFFRSRRSALLAMAVFALSYLPYASAGVALTESLTRFGGGTSFFSLGETLGILDFSSSYTKIIVAIVLVLWISWIGYRTTSYIHAASSSLSLLLLFMPIIHYWYVSWVLVFVPFIRHWRWVAAALAMVFYFEAQVAQVSSGAWSMPTWAPMVVWVSLGVGWLVDVVQAKSTQRVPPTNTL